MDAAAVARVGAGIALDDERAERRVLELPGAETFAGLPTAVTRVLGEASFGAEARALADAARTLPPADAALDVLAATGTRFRATGVEQLLC